MKILVVGGSGMLGHKLVQVLGSQFEVWATIRNKFEDFREFQIFDKNKLLENINGENDPEIEKVINDVNPQVIINAVGIIKQIPTAQDVVETLTINSILPHKLAAAAKKNNSRFITISTDCVFRGDKGFYREDDISDAIDLYGKSKNLGEVTTENCLTLRTSIIGRELLSRHSLVEWFLNNRGEKVKGFVNAIYSGFPTIIFAGIIADVIINHPKLQGLYHVSSKPINKYDLLRLINEKYDAGIEIEADEKFKIDRSLNSSKFRNETGFNPPEWDEMIEMMASDPTPYDDWKK
ncbi:MAG: SDR family oxidoreductase [Acidobacteriota bacterium]|nr:SDR family oxidoreductase [Acidobacteriota bacterium]